MATSPSGLNFTVDPRTIATPDDLAVALSALRARAALTVRDLARRADIPSSTVGGYLSGRHLPPPTQPDLVARLLLALSVPADQQDEWLDALWRVRSWRRGPGADQRAPFLGLRAFDRPDADLFFGRATETAALAAMVRGSAGALVAVVGPSGSGKTSLIRAGLCAALPADWVVAVQTPRADPVGAVAALREAAQAPRTSPDTHCVVVLDQAEELWTLAPDAAARTRAVADLATLTSDPTTHVVVGLRSDFFTEAAAEPALLAALQTHQFVLGSPGRDALAETVTGPAAEFGIPIAPGLVDLIVDDAVSGAAGRSAVLPHLSHTLAMMWEHAVRRELSAESYQAVGRVAGAVAQSAEAAYAELAPEQRKLARALLLRLVVVEEGLPPTSAVVPVADLPEEHLEVLRHFTARRLIVADSDTVRFSHEAVLSAWSDLARWVAEDRQTLALHRTVSRAEADHDPSLLLRGSRLAAVRDWPTGLRLAPGPVVTDFLEASRRAEDDAAERARRVHRRTRRLLAGSSVLAAATAVTAAGLIASRVTIASERDQARSRQIAAESRAFAASDVALAHRLAVAAFDTDDTVQARSQLTVSTADPAMTTIDGPVGPVMVEPVVVEPVEPTALPLLVAPTVHQPAEPKLAEPASTDPVQVETEVAEVTVAPVVVAEPVAAAAELAEPQSSLPAPAPLVAPVMALPPLLVAPPAASAPVESPATSAPAPVVPPVVPPPVVPAEPGVDDVFDPADEFPEHAPAVGGSRRWFLALLVVMAVGGGVLAWYNTRPETSVVPELAGLRQGAALNQLGPFEATIIEEASETVEPGVVIRSEPAAGTTLENGSKITLVVSTGPAPRALPELVGLTLADATAQLGELGLVLIEAEPQFDEVVVPGVVLSWSVPAAPTLGVGATVTKGTTVQVVLSAGPAPRSVPALAGLTFEDATKVLQDLGLVIFRVPDEFDVNVPAGTVIRQDIPAGSAVERGAQVSVAVSKGQDVIVMPALAGLDYNTVVAALQGAGFVIGSVVGDTTQAFQSATVNAAPVVDAQQFLRGTKVDLTFAPTPAPVVTVVPGG